MNAPHHNTCIYFYFCICTGAATELLTESPQMMYHHNWSNRHKWCTDAIDVPPQLIDLPRHIAEPTDSPQRMQRFLKWWNHRDCHTCHKWHTTTIDWFAVNDATARIDLPAAIDWFAAALSGTDWYAANDVTARIYLPAATAAIDWFAVAQGKPKGKKNLNTDCTCRNCLPQLTDSQPHKASWKATKTNK
jgi:hypothetical protein